MNITDHAKYRIENRLSKYVSKIEVVHAVDRPEYNVGETHVLVKKLPEPVEFMDGDLRIHGDQVWAVVKRRGEWEAGNVVTVMVRNSTQPARGDYQVTELDN